jgi:hypothetical protein
MAGSEKLCFRVVYKYTYSFQVLVDTGQFAPQQRPLELHMPIYF